MDYYIQGSPARAEEIKAAFEKLGFDPACWAFAGAHSVYFTVPGDNKVKSLHISIGKVIMTHPDYQELELPAKPNFKVGDWVVIDNNHNSTYQVECVREHEYMLKHTHGGLMPFPFSSETRLRLWTIEDVKDGDVLVTTKIRSCPFIYRKTSYSNRLAYYYAGIDGNGNFSDGCLKNTLHHFGLVSDVVPATKGQRDQLFAKMREAGYEWDEKKKELRKVKEHYDICNFHAGMPVLVRADNNCKWDYSVFSRITGNVDWNFAVCNGVIVAQCIPFEGNEHLLGTTDMPSECYINW